MHPLVRLSTAAFAALGLPSLALAQVTFTPIGDLPGGTVSSRAADVSGDGTTVVGSSAGENVTTQAVRWTEAGGLESLDATAPSGGTVRVATGASEDGSVITGFTNNLTPFVWDATNGIDDFGDESPALPALANAISDDGTVVVGQVVQGTVTNFDSFRRTTSAFEVLDQLPVGATRSEARGVSADGSVLVGTIEFADFAAFRWTSATGFETLPDLPGGPDRATANDVSPDGQVTVGRCASGSNESQACRWIGTGAPLGLGDLPGGGFESTANGVSADGSVVVGSASIDGGAAAFVWTAAGGIEALSDVLVDAGVDLTGWMLTSANGVSDDGRILVGEGVNPSGEPEGWVVDLPEPASGGLAALAALALLGRRASRA